MHEVPSPASEQLSSGWWRWGKKGKAKEGMGGGSQATPSWLDWFGFERRALPDAQVSELPSLSRRCEIATADECSDKPGRGHAGEHREQEDTRRQLYL